MFNKIISIILTCIFCLNILPAFAAEDTSIIVNETFSDIATNGKPASGAIIESGIDGRVIKDTDGNKVLYAKAWGDGVQIKVPINSSSDKMVFSYDVKISGAPLMGSILSLSSASPVFRYSGNRTLTLDDDRVIDGYRDNVWKSYAVAVNFAKGSYDLYIDGKLTFKNHYFYNTPKTPKEMIFAFAPMDDDSVSEVMLDNIRVYSGTEILPESAFPKRSYNSNVLPFEPTLEKKVYDEVYIDSFGKEGIVATPIQKDDSIVKWDKMPGDSNTYMHIAKTGKTDPYASITTNMPTNATKFVYQLDVYPVNNENTLNLSRFMNNTGKPDSQIFRLYQKGNGSIIGADAGLGYIEYERWTTLAAACDLVSGTADFYVDGELIKADVPLLEGGCVPTSIRIGCVSGNVDENCDFYFNRVKLYAGTELKTFGDEPVNGKYPGSASSGNDNVQSDELELTSPLETEAQAKQLLGSNVAFVTSNPGYFYDRDKREYTDGEAMAYEAENGEIIVPASLMNKTLDTDISYDEQSGKGTALGRYELVPGTNIIKDGSKNIELTSEIVYKDGDLYIPAASFAEKVLNKYSYSDGRGFVIISSQKLDMTDTNLPSEPSDVIQRYLHYTRPTGDDIYEAVTKLHYREHPRLSITSEGIEQLKHRIESNDKNKEIFKTFLKSCDKYLTQPLTKYEKPDGLRLYGALASTAGYMINMLGYAYQLTGDDKYAKRAWEELENILSWSDWNLDDHYLDSGAAVPNITNGFDLIYNYLTKEQRAYFADRFQTMYLDYAVGVYSGSSRFQALNGQMTTSNWGAVCGRAMLCAGLVLIDEEDENSPLTQKSKFLASQALQSLETVYGLLFPDGLTEEGVVYWEYFLTNLSEVSATLLSMCGTDYDTLSSPGFENSSLFGLYIQDANGPFTYAETEELLPIYFPLSAFLHASLYGDTERMNALESYRKVLGAGTEFRYLLWNNLTEEQNSVDYSLDHYFNGEQITVMKSSWDDKEGIYIGVVGGQNTGLNHVDKGSFVFHALGEKWFFDMGHDDYNINNTDSNEGYWNVDTRRRLYRIRAEGHNCVVINPTPDNYGQVMGAEAVLTEFESKDKGSKAVYDLTEVYGEDVKSYKRGFLFGDGRESLIVQDEIELTKQSEVYWFGQTKTNITINPDGKSATLDKNGKKVRVEFYSDAPEWEIYAMDATPLSPETKANGEMSRDGIRKLAFKAKASGRVNISVKIIPLSEYSDYKSLEFTPVSEWSVPDGELIKPELSTLSINGVPLKDFTPGQKNYRVELPYGSDIPEIGADSSTGNYEITKNRDFTEPALITVYNADGDKAVYEIWYDLNIAITDSFTSAGLSMGLPSGAKLINASAEASHIPQPDNTPANTVDGDFKTRWSADTDGSYLELDLGSVQDISAIAMAFMDGSRRYSNFELMISEDRQNYTRIFNGKSLMGTDEWQYLPIVAKARYIRYVGHGNSESEWNSVTEFRAVAN